MSTQNKFTPGPWKVRMGINEAFIDAPHIICLAVVNSLDETRKEVANCKANARLIAAAPELLAALDAVIQTCEDGIIHRSETGKPPWTAFGHLKALASAAIAKAREGAK